MRSFNTTSVNLRAALDDVDPLVDAAKPVALRLRPFFRELRGASSRPVPTVRDLDQVVRRGGRDNDLVEFTRLQVPLSRIALGPVQGRHEARRRSALSPGRVPRDRTLRDSLPQLAFLRPYTPELVVVRRLLALRDLRRQRRHRPDQHHVQLVQRRVTRSPSPFQPPIDPSTVFGGSGTRFWTRGTRSAVRANERNPGDGSTPFTEGAGSTAIRARFRWGRR